MFDTEFYIDIKITGKLGLNGFYSGKNYYERKRQADGIHKIVYASLLTQKIPRKKFEKPVRIKILYPQTSKLDIDNHSVLGKMIIDGLKGYLLIDDDKRYVMGFWQDFYSGNKIKVSIEDWYEIN